MLCLFIVKIFAMRNSYLIYIFTAVLTTSWTSGALAQLRYKNLSPLIGQLPSLTIPGIRQNELASARYSATVETANYLSNQRDNQLTYNVDGETSVIDQTMSYRSNTFTFGLNVALAKQGSGYLDDAIYDFHDTFGMPQNGRTKPSNGHYAWEILNGTHDVYSSNNSTSGLSTLSAFIEGGAEASLNLLWRMELHLPSASVSKRLGTDTTGLSVTLASNANAVFSDYRFIPTLDIWYGGGVLWQHSDSESINSLGLQNLVATVESGIAYHLGESVSLLSQIDITSPYFDNNIRELGWSPVVLSSAIRTNWYKKTIDIGFREDIRPSTSPDFSIFLSFTADL